MVPMAMRKGWTSLLLAAAGAGAGPAQAQPAAPPSSSPPIGDADFQAALPPLDATAPPTTAAIPATPPGGAAPLPPAATAAMPAGPTPAEDGELARPLPPIATFDATPPPATAADTADDAPRIRYTTEIRGLKDVGLEGTVQGALGAGEGRIEGRQRRAGIGARR